MITITKTHLEELKTPRGGYTNATLHALGLSIKNNKGWRSRLLGKTFSEEQYAKALEGREKKVEEKDTFEKICINGKWYLLVELL